MIIPIGDCEIQDMILVHKDTDGQVVTKSHGKFRFVPMLGEREWKQ